MCKAAEIVHEYNLHGCVTIDLIMESPDLSSTELPEFFNYLSSTGVDCKKITILTGNLLESYQGVNVQIMPHFMYELKDLQELKYTEADKDIQFYFGCMVSRTTLPRLDLSSYLFCNHSEKTFQTFHWQHNSDYHKTHLELEKLLELYGPTSNEFADAITLLKHSPLLGEDNIVYPPVKQKYDILPWYNKFFIDIVCETWYQGNNFFLTEKFWRSVRTKTPFIVQGPQNVLTNLKKLGFKTFSNYWDEGYQEDPSYYNLTEIKKTIDYVARKPKSEIESMYKDMYPILEHNYETMMNLSCNDIAQTIGKKK